MRFRRARFSSAIGASFLPGVSVCSSFWRVRLSDLRLLGVGRRGMGEVLLLHALMTTRSKWKPRRPRESMPIPEDKVFSPFLSAARAGPHLEEIRIAKFNRATAPQAI